MQENQPQAPTANSLQTTVTVDNRPKANSFLVILLSILLFISCVIAGFFAFQTQQLVNELRVVRDELKQTPTPIAEPIVTSDPTANWKTYTNATLGFLFKHPVAWTESGPISRDDTTIVYVHSDEKIGAGPEPIQYYLGVTNIKMLPDTQYSKEIINGYTVYKSDSATPSRFGSLSYFITKDEKQYVGIFLTPYNAEVTATFPSQDKYVKIFNQILSTFKFVD